MKIESVVNLFQNNAYKTIESKRKKKIKNNNKNKKLSKVINVIII